MGIDISTEEIKRRYIPGISLEGISGMTAGEGRRVLKSMVTSESDPGCFMDSNWGTPESQKRRISGLLEDNRFIGYFDSNWEKGLNAIFGSRRVSSHQDSTVMLGKFVGDDISLAFITLEKSLGLAFRGAGVKSSRETGLSSSYTVPFRKMTERDSSEIYDSYLMACYFFKSEFRKVSGEKAVSEVEKNSLMPFKRAQERRNN